VKKVIFLSIILFTGISLFAQSRLKIGFVNSQSILQQYPLAVKAQSDLNALVAKWNKKINNMTTKLKNAYAKFQQQANTMPPDRKKAAQQKLIQMQQQISNYKESIFNQPNGEYYAKQDSLLAPVKKKIMAAINKIAKREKMNFVFDKSGDILLLYADERYNITFKVLDLLRRGK